MIHPHPKRSFVPQAVLTRSGKLSTVGVAVNTVRPFNTANTKAVNTVRPVNTANTKAVNTVKPVNTANTKAVNNAPGPGLGAVSLRVSASFGTDQSPASRGVSYQWLGPARIRMPSARWRCCFIGVRWLLGPWGGALSDARGQAGGWWCVASPEALCLVVFSLLAPGDVGWLPMVGNKCYLDKYEYYDGRFISFGDGKGRISGKGKIKTGSLDFDDVYFWRLTCFFAKAIIYESNTWHRRLGHINFKIMNKLEKGNLIKGLPSKIFKNDHSCVACQKGKQHKASYKTKLVNSISKPLHMLHMDLFGPTNIKSLMKKSYCLVVTDDFSRFSWVLFFTTKDKTSGILKTFITEIENQLDHKVKVIRSDNRTEFKNCIMNQYCEMKGIKREFSVAKTPQQNAVNIACYVLNRVLVIKPHNKTPYELIRGRPPLIDFMKPFGCLVTILNTRDHLGKFDGKADEGYLLGSIAQKEKEPEQEYILIPLCTTDPLISQGPKDYKGDAGMKPTNVDENEASDKSGKQDQEARSESERFSPFKNAFTLPPIPNISSIDNTGIFGNAYDDEDVEEEFDMNNVISSYSVPDTSFTKFHKDHPEDQVIGSLKNICFRQDT
ncbi:putative ribonuclease H-like domain-containing protein [Tanacetum coccineum]|uniref:Ribonuclease H-like domain-containing protein n=1 Tax=Tanacetum coccineum TaxID=301880 RepID=A0ABQ4XRH5_9ASTR